MHKHDIEACFTHWMGRQEEGKIGFEFTNVFNSREGTLWPAVRLQELTDLDDMETEGMTAAPRNPPKRKRTKKKTKGKWPKATTQQPESESAPVPKQQKKKQPDTPPLAITPINQQAAGLAPLLPENLMPLEWDLLVDPMLQKALIPLGRYVTAEDHNIPAMT
ncbi:hypothetical protein L208DRAFT_1413479, partial [Tricholoma matsutake]